MTKDLIAKLTPLAERIRPQNLDEIAGQEELLNSEGPIGKAIIEDNPFSFIMWGPPGTGKTSIAKIIANKSSAQFYKLNAISSGVKELREIIEDAKKIKRLGKSTILFIDEIHRFNKTQQDAMLNAVENGEIILIAATTENPSFQLTPALRSRVRIFTLNELGVDSLDRILKRAIEKDVILQKLNITYIDKNHLFLLSGGDARTMLNIFESAINHIKEQENIRIDKEILNKVIQKRNSHYDKNGEEHYNVISAFIKSLRGSDPDAAIYWLARMLNAGEDISFIARRMIIFASEDIGNASPRALILANSTFEAVNKIGMPEARIILSQCAAYLASCPKSNSSYTAINQALDDVRSMPCYKVPIHLRNAPTKLLKELNYGADYKYSHNYEGNFVEQDYLPKELKGKQYYKPSNNGAEKSILEQLKKIWKDKKKY